MPNTNDDAYIGQGGYANPGEATINSGLPEEVINYLRLGYNSNTSGTLNIDGVGTALFVNYEIYASRNSNTTATFNLTNGDTPQFRSGWAQRAPRRCGGCRASEECRFSQTCVSGYSKYHANRSGMFRKSLGGVRPACSMT